MKVAAVVCWMAIPIVVSTLGIAYLSDWPTALTCISFGMVGSFLFVLWGMVAARLLRKSGGK